MSAHLIAEEGPLAGKILRLENDDQWVIGRDSELCNLPLEDSTVSREHVFLRKAEDGIWVKNLSTINPILVNDEPFEQEILLKQGDRIKIGQNIFLFSEEAFEQSPYDSIFEETPTSEEKSPYDTIFDEEEIEQEVLPFHLMGTSPLLLKVISGPNAGAEIGIEKSKSYIIGKDPNSCDVVFQDLSVSKNHSRVSVDANGIITIEDLNSKNGTLVNGKAIEEATTITPNDAIALGTTTFLIIDREAGHETIYAAPEMPVEEEKEQEVVKAPISWKKQIIPTKYLLLAGSLSLIVFIVFISFFSLFKADEITISKKDYTEEIKENIEMFDGITFSYNPATQKLFLAGHVLTGVEEKELLYKLTFLSFVKNIENNVIIDEMLSKNVNELIAENNNWQGIRIYNPNPGRFVVAGYLQTVEEGEKLADFLIINFPYTDLLQNNVVIEQLLNTEIQSLLYTNGFESLSFQLTSGDLILAGMFHKDKQRQLNSLIDHLSKLHGVDDIKNLTTASSQLSSSINLSTRYSVSGNSKSDGEGFNVVINGRILGIGDMLDGMKIINLETGLVMLEKDDLKYRIEYSM